MIGYAIWDRTASITNESLRRYIQDTFLEIKLDFGDVTISDSIYKLFELPCDHLVVFSSGHTTRSAAQLRDAIETFCQHEFLIAGHIIQHGDDYPFLHPQMFIVNLARWRQLDKPRIGLYESGDLLLHQPERSSDNVHDHHTPLWLRPTGRSVLTNTRGFGWNLIHTSLDVGLSVSNLPNRIRFAKRYLYPENQPDRLAECLALLAQDALTDIPEDMDYNQAQYLRSLLTPGVQCRVYLVNTERLIEPLPEPAPPARRIFGTASGFKLFSLWAQLGASAEVVYFDHNHMSLWLWQKIVQRWSGENFADFCQKLGYQDDFSKLRLLFDSLGGQSRFQALWHEYCATRPTFVHCDVLRDPQPLIEAMAPDGNYVWYSNCFRFFEGIRRYGIAGCEQKEQDFLARLHQQAADTVCLGRTFD